MNYLFYCYVYEIYSKNIFLLWLRQRNVVRDWSFPLQRSVSCLVAPPTHKFVILQVKHWRALRQFRKEVEKNTVYCEKRALNSIGRIGKWCSKIRTADVMKTRRYVGWFNALNVALLQTNTPHTCADWLWLGRVPSFPFVVFICHKHAMSVTVCKLECLMWM